MILFGESAGSDMHPVAQRADFSTPLSAGARWRPISLCLLGVIAGIAILADQAIWLHNQRRSKSHNNSTRQQQRSHRVQAAHCFAYLLIAVVLTDWPLPSHQAWIFYIGLLLWACSAFRLLLLAAEGFLPSQHSAVPLNTEEELTEHHQRALSPSIPRTSGATIDPKHEMIISRHAPTASFGQLSLSSIGHEHPKLVVADGSEHFVFSALPVEEQSPVKEFKDEGIRAMLKAATKSDARSTKRPRGTRKFTGTASPEALDSCAKLSPPAVPKSLPPSPEHSPRALPTLPSTSSLQSTQDSPKPPMLSLPALSDGRLFDNPHAGGRSSSSYDFQRKRSKRQSITLPGIGALELSSDSESDYDVDSDEEEQQAAGSLLGNPNAEEPSALARGDASRRSSRNSAVRRLEKETRAIKRELSQGSADRERRLKLQAALELA